MMKVADNRNNKKLQGDTIIEVVLSMALLSAILFTSWGVVNKSSQISIAARQRIVMVDSIKEQAEIIKSMYDNPDTQKLVVGGSRTFGNSAAQSPVSSLSLVHQNPCDSTRGSEGVNTKIPSSAFYFDDTVTSKSGVKGVDNYDNAKVWIQMHDGGAEYVDFYIRACWITPGGHQNEDNTHLVMRLNK